MSCFFLSDDWIILVKYTNIVYISVIMVSIKTKYAIAVVVNLALNNAKGAFTIKQLSESCKVPKKYLEQLLNSLRKEGILDSIRGANGGYFLARPAQQIKVFDIAYCLENTVKFSNGYNGSSALASFWLTIDNDLKESLNVTISDIIKNHVQSSGVLTYSI